MIYQLGDRVRGLTLLRPDGASVALSAFLGKPLLVIFLRHLAWIPCLAHLGEVRDKWEQIRRAGGEALLVVQARPELLSAHLREQSLPFPAVTDPSRAAYRAFGLERTSWARMLRPRVLVGYLRLVFGGWLPRLPYGGEDVLQLGGDFILDAAGRLCYAYRSAEPTDRPGVDELLRAVRAVC